MAIEVLPRPASSRSPATNDALDRLAALMSDQQAAAKALPKTIAEFCETAIALAGPKPKFPMLVPANGRIYRVFMIGGQPVARELPLSAKKES